MLYRAGQALEYADCESANRKRRLNGLLGSQRETTPSCSNTSFYNTQAHSARAHKHVPRDRANTDIEIRAD